MRYFWFGLVPLLLFILIEVLSILIFHHPQVYLFLGLVLYYIGFYVFIQSSEDEDRRDALRYVARKERERDE